MIDQRMNASAAGRVLMAAALLATLGACGDAQNDVPEGYQESVTKAANGEDVELDIVDEKADNLTDEQKSELKSWEDRQNEEINRRLEEMRDK